MILHNNIQASFILNQYKSILYHYIWCHQFYCMNHWQTKSNKATNHCAGPNCLTTLDRSIFYKADPSFVESYASNLGADIERHRMIQHSQAFDHSSILFSTFFAFISFYSVSLQGLHSRPKSQTIPNSPRPASSARAFWALTQLRAFSLPWAQWAQLVLLVTDFYQMTISEIHQNTTKATENQESDNLNHFWPVLTSSFKQPHFKALGGKHMEHHGTQ